MPRTTSLHAVTTTLAVAAIVSAGQQPTPSPEALERVAQLEREWNAVKQEAADLGEGSNITESIENVKTRKYRNEDQIRRMEEAIERAGGTKAELEAERKRLEEESIRSSTTGDKAAKTGATGLARWLVGAAAKNLLKVVGIVMEAAEAGARKDIKDVNVMALEEAVKRQQLTLNDMYGLTAALYDQVGDDIRTLKKLEDIQRREREAWSRWVSAKNLLGQKYNVTRELDTAGDQKLKAEEEAETKRRNKKRAIVGLAGGAAVIGAVTLSGGGGSTASTPTVATPQAVAPAPTPTPTPATGPISANGNYRTNVVLASDSAGQASTLALPSEIVLTFNVSGSNLAVTCPPGARWVPGSGTIDPGTGRFTTFGIGPLAGRDRAARLDGGVDRNGRLAGTTYTVEFGSASTVYTVEGSRQ